MQRTKYCHSKTGKSIYILYVDMRSKYIEFFLEFLFPRLAIRTTAVPKLNHTKQWTVKFFIFLFML